MSFDLESAVGAWRQRFADRRGMPPEDLDELEAHLRDDIAHRRARGASAADAFHAAAQAVGDVSEAEAEYRKVYWGKLQRHHAIAGELALQLAMARAYFRATLRGLARRKGYSFINIAGLTLGLACCLVIFQFVAFEYSFDRFHAHERDLYRVLQTTTLVSEVFGEWGGDYTGFALAPALAESVPEIARVVRLHPEYGGALVANPARPERVFEEDRLFYADPAFLEMFTFPLIAGSPRMALEPGTMLVSEKAARKYFGDADPIGQVLDVTGSTEQSYRVTGVFKDVPFNSHLQFEMLLPMKDLLGTEDYRNEPEGGWSWNNFTTYIQLVPGSDVVAVERKMRQAYETRRGDVLREQGRKVRLWAQPLRDVHLNNNIQSWEGIAAGSYRTVYFFTVIGFVTLLIALINYVNLATARALDRAAEVGVRKAVGARREQLAGQFLFESALVNGMAALLALGLSLLLVPALSALVGVRLPWSLWLSPWFWLAFAATFVASSLLAGLYPALVLSSFRPAAVLKGRLGTGGRVRAWVRQGLVVVQFALAVVLIGGTAVVYDQLRFMRHMDLGLELEQVLTVDGPRVLPEGTDLGQAMTTFVQEIERIPSVLKTARSTSLPGQGFNWNGASFRKAEDNPASTLSGVVTYIDTSFADVYGLRLAAGRDFSEVTSADTAGGMWPVMASESTTRALGFTSPGEAVGEALDIGGYAATLVGVYEDFSWSSAHEARQSVFFGYTGGGRHVSMRVGAADLPAALPAIEAVYHRLFPGNVFQYAFADEVFAAQYQKDERFATLFTFFAGLAIAIACLGLFGLAAFTAQQRRKEIGVRKALGASVLGLSALLTRDFLKLVGVAVLVGIPVAYLLMRRWLAGFAYQTDLGVGIFVLVAVLALLLALLTVAYQATRAALTDPVRALRAE